MSSDPNALKSDLAAFLPRLGRFPTDFDVYIENMIQAKASNVELWSRGWAHSSNIRKKKKILLMHLSMTNLFRDYQAP